MKAMVVVQVRDDGGGVVRCGGLLSRFFKVELMSLRYRGRERKSK